MCMGNPTKEQNMTKNETILKAAVTKVIVRSKESHQGTQFMQGEDSTTILSTCSLNWYPTRMVRLLTGGGVLGFDP